MSVKWHGAPITGTTGAREAALAKKKKKHPYDPTGPHVKLTWEQVCELRRWHEQEGVGAKRAFRRAKELGWPVVSESSIRAIIYYENRTKR